MTLRSTWSLSSSTTARRMMCVAASGCKLLEFGKAFCDYGDRGGDESGPCALGFKLIRRVQSLPLTMSKRQGGGEIGLPCTSALQDLQRCSSCGHRRRGFFCRSAFLAHLPNSECTSSGHAESPVVVASRVACCCPGSPSRAFVLPASSSAVGVYDYFCVRGRDDDPFLNLCNSASSLSNTSTRIQLLPGSFICKVHPSTSSNA